MKIGIIGSGGREHAICTFLKSSSKVDKIYCFPGNAGTNFIAENININLNNFQEVKDKIKELKIDIVIVGPEKPLVDGIVDFLEKNEIKVFGPNKISSQLEGSKIFTKKLCEKYKIPTANFGVFEDKEKSLNFLKKCKFPIVVKADGLASGKGVYICDNFEQSRIAVDEIFNGKFGKAKEILVEEFLKGEEMSFFIISDGKTYKKFGSAQDHKRVLEGDKGKNTGGMGAYSPSRLENEELDKKIIERIIDPTLKGLKDLNTNFKGFLYAGLMIVNNNPYLIEYNVRMGDPECQTILPRVETDFADIIYACVNQNLSSVDIQLSNKKSICIVLCSKGYPDKFENNIKINTINQIKLQKDNYIFHAGTRIDNSIIYSNGGRVLNFVIKSANLKESRDQAINLIKALNWENGFFRKDIGYKVIEQ
ncbi:phosphoribosylamine--glycine ligase [Candidatus Pelagibacter sp.]|uniref:phosphoribosylamine--glycine ligase n=1 Tax=Candidatus Pelagibacter sp. TaxID=2024849 RepID=UPI003F868AC7